MAGLVSQVVAEPAVAPTSAAERVSQVIAEPAVAPTVGSLRLSAVGAEPVVWPTSIVNLRLSTLVMEVVVKIGGSAFLGEPWGAYW